MRKTRNLNTMTFRLPNSMRQQVEQVAIENEASPSEVIRYALSNLIESEANKEKLREYKKKYREANKEKLREYGKKYYKQYYKANKDKIKLKNKQ